MENTFSTLVSHGAAPFQFFEKNGPSYFAVLRDAEGVESTVWGVDIERSLHEAGAEIGNSISLVRGGKEPVVVKVPNEKGVMEDKTVDRIIWNTEIGFEKTKAVEAVSYDLFDPFAEVNYPFKTIDEAVEKADSLGAVRFFAKNQSGVSTPITKAADGNWMQGDQVVYESDDIVISQSMELKKDITEPKVVPSESEKAKLANEKAGDGLYAVIAPYMLDGLHNHLGIDLAEKLNDRIAMAGLAGNKKGIQEMLDADPEAKRFMLGIVDRQRYLEDQHRKQNRSEPETLLGGLFVRDGKGGYHPVAGGPVVLVDKGDSLTLKGKSQDAYKAAIELAAAKGWTTIELKGKPAMMAGIWLEAQMAGVKVVNYTPNEKDHEKLAGMIAARDKLRASDLASEKVAALAAGLTVGEEVSPEQVEVREFVGADGKARTATITYTVSYEAEGVLMDDKFDNPKEAGEAFAALPVATRPMVVRAATRIDGDMKSNIIAVTDALPGIDPVKSVDAKLDHEFHEAFETAVAAENAQEIAALNVVDVVKPGQQITGKILKVEGGIVYQDRGCGAVFKHDANSLSRVPKAGEREVIKYDQSGRGVVKDREVEREQGLELAR